MTIAYFQIFCVLWKSDTIPGHKESYKPTHAIGRKYIYTFHSIRHKSKQNWNEKKNPINSRLENPLKRMKILKEAI